MAMQANAGGRLLASGQRLPLTADRYAVGVSWDRSGTPVDLDLQCVVIDDRGSVIDAVYYNNMKAQRCITHSGDEQTGERKGLDEIVWAGLDKLKENVKILCFVVAAHSGGHLRDVSNGTIHVMEGQEQNEIGRLPMEHSRFDVDLVLAMVRGDGGSWELLVIDEPAQEGQHFMDVLEPTIGSFVRGLIPAAPKRLKVAFAMEKGSVVDLPSTSTLHAVTAGLGWDVAGKGVDLDVSAVLFDGAGTNVDVVFFGRLKACGLVHSGDNLTGHGAGDDEQIKCQLEEVPPSVEHIIFAVHIYTKGVTFGRVSNPYCRIFDTAGSELARFELHQGGSESGLLLARLFREPGNQRWGFQALGNYSRGTLWKDSLGDMQALIRDPPAQLRPRPPPPPQQAQAQPGAAAPEATPEPPGRQQSGRIESASQGPPPGFCGKPPGQQPCVLQ